MYDYDKNINVITTPKGDKVISMNSEIFTELIVNLLEAEAHQKQDGRMATAETTRDLIEVLRKGVAK